MTSSNAVAEPALGADAPADETLTAQAPELVDGGAAARSPFQLLPVGEAFGVCDVDGVCH